MGSRITIRDVAKEAGVSASAVSFALNNKPGVSSRTRAHVIEVAGRMGWQPNPVAKALSEQQAGAVGLVLTRPPNTVRDEGFFFPFLCGISEFLAHQHRQLLFRLATSREEELRIYRTWAGTRQAAGVILVDLTQADQRPAELDQLNLPSVSVGDDLGVGSALVVDDALAMNRIISHIFGQGFQCPAYVSGMEGFEHTHIRRTAFEQRCQELGLNSTNTFTSNYTQDAGAALTRTIMEKNPQTDLIIFDNELLTFGGIAYLRSQNIQIPGQVGVFSWEDSMLCQVFSPPISALGRDAEALGVQAASVLCHSLETRRRVVDYFPTPAVIARATTSKH